MGKLSSGFELKNSRNCLSISVGDRLKLKKKIETNLFHFEGLFSFTFSRAFEDAA